MLATEITSGRAIRRAKLMPPRLGAGLIPRPRLTEELNNGLSVPVTLVVGPAGFGKTTVLGEWVASCPVPCAWFTLDHGDTDLARFVTHFVAAIQTIDPTVGNCAKSLLEVAQPSPEEIGETLADELFDMKREFVLVLDDFHEAVDSSILSLLAALLQYPSTSMHLVISSRWDPQVPIARLRGKGHLSEIRAADLRFTVDETRLLIANATESEPDPDFVAFIQERTEGWVAGLRLVSVALRAPNVGADLAESMAASGERHVMNFLLDEVLERQPEQVQRFLLRTSISDRVCGSLADVLTEFDLPSGSSDVVLEGLARSNLYVEPVGEDLSWYRYHALFRDLLRHRLIVQFGELRVAELHAIASKWFFEHGHVDEAITHACAAGDRELAASFVEESRHDALARQDWTSVDHWLHLLPDAVVRQRPKLLMTKIRIAQHRGQMTSLRLSIGEVDQLLARDDAASDHDVDRFELEAERDLIKARSICLDENPEGVRDLALNALDRLPIADRQGRGFAAYLYGSAMRACGESQESVRRLNDMIADYLDPGDAFSSQVLLTQALINWEQGNLDECERIAAYVERISSERGLETSTAWARLTLGMVAYERNDLVTAALLFMAIVSARDSCDFVTLRDGLLGLALTQEATGDSGSAASTVENLLEIILEREALEHLHTIDSFRTRLDLMSGRSQHALRSLNCLPVHIDFSNLSVVEVDLITWVKLLIQEGSPESLAGAAVYLDELSERAAAVDSRRRTAEIDALRALIYDATGQSDRALAILDESVRLGLERGLQRTYVDLGGEIGALLRQLQAASPEVEGLDALIEACIPPLSIREDSSGPALSVDSTPRSEKKARSPRTHILELLTEREAEILSCLDLHLSNQEIAERLFISPLTVKRHASNIYDKLGVGSRRQALVKATELGFLQPR
jgi:LuxR family maltose regulon positive regulatory protein